MTPDHFSRAKYWYSWFIIIIYVSWGRFITNVYTFYLWTPWSDPQQAVLRTIVLRISTIHWRCIDWLWIINKQKFSGVFHALHHYKLPSTTPVCGYTVGVKNKFSGVATTEAVRHLPWMKFGSLISNVLKPCKHCLTYTFIWLAYRHLARINLQLLIDTTSQQSNLYCENLFIGLSWPKDSHNRELFTILSH